MIWILVALVPLLLLALFIYVRLPKNIGKMTKGQLIFLVSYPVLHSILVLGVGFLALCLTGFGSVGHALTPLEHWEIVTLGFFMRALMAPSMLLRPFGFDQVSFVYIVGEFLFAGIVYGFVWLWAWKLIAKNTHNE